MQPDYCTSQYSTNSILQLQLPPRLSPDLVTVEWQVESNPHLPSILRYCPLQKSLTFGCNPLQLGASIKGRLLKKDSSVEQPILKKQFGSIAPDRQILALMGHKKIFQIGVAVERGNNLKGTVQLNTTGVIEVRANLFNMDIRMQEDMVLPCKSTFLKFFPRQPQCLGISIYHQHAEFSEKIKKIRNVHSMEFYLKISFESRQSRDVFLYQILKQFGLPDYLFSQKTSRFIQTSQSPNKMSEINEQIQNLLADQSSHPSQISFDLGMAENLLFSCKDPFVLNKVVLDHSFQNNETENKDWNISIKNGSPGLLDERNRALHETQVNRMKPFDEMIPYKNKQAHSLMPEHQEEDELLREQIRKLRNEVIMLEAENRRLARQNNELKEENKQLRRSNTTNTSFKVSPEMKSNGHDTSNRISSRSSKSPLNSSKPTIQDKKIANKEHLGSNKKKKIGISNLEVASTGSVMFGATNPKIDKVKNKYKSTSSTKDLILENKLGASQKQICYSPVTQQRFRSSNSFFNNSASISTTNWDSNGWYRKTQKPGHHHHIIQNGITN